MSKKNPITLIVLFLPVLLLAGTTTGDDGSLLHKMTVLIFQLGIIIFVAKGGESLAEKLNLPSILGQLTAGIIIGPFLLGAISFPGFSHGLFPLADGTIPVSTELYGLSTIASILLLFGAGLETDLNLFLRYAFSGSVVGIGGLIFSFVIGDFIGVWLIDEATFLDPRCLFLGVISTATSVGVTARILSKRRSMDSPEGVTIMSGAVIDDVLGVVLLAVVIGIAEMESNGGNHVIPWSKISFIAFKTIGIWLVFSVFGLAMAHKISVVLKKLKNKNTITIMAFGLSLLFAGVFEKFGLAMIIGAYVMGLSLSSTDLSYVIQESLHPLEKFFVPLFFTVMGMMVNVKIFLDSDILLLGFIYSLGAVLSKVVGCALPSLLLNFNKIGALRVGFGMAPRSEVALIIAGIGLSEGILDSKLFGACIMMPFISIFLSAPMLGFLFKKREPGVKHKTESDDNKIVVFDFLSPDQTKFLLSIILEYFATEGFYIYRIELDCIVYQIRKDNIFITMLYKPKQLMFKSKHDDVLLIKTLVNEAFLKLKTTIQNFDLEKNSAQFNNHHLNISGTRKFKIDIAKILNIDSIIMKLNATTKWEAIEELVNHLYWNSKITDKEKVLSEVVNREKIMSTGMQNGFAIPHARTEGVEKVELAVGFHREGIEFESMDGKPARIIVLLISSVHENDPHIQILAAFAQFLYPQGAIESLLNCKTKDEVYAFFKQ